jgi:hypothetical protein
MTSYFQERAGSKALQAALERYDALLEAGSTPDEARAEVLATLQGEFRVAFALATSLPSAAEAVPDEAFAAALERKLRTTPIAPRRVVRPATGFRVVLAAAAAIIVLGAFLVPAMHSLPGDPLYALKTASEDARVFVATGSGEARVRLDLANTRFREVEKLVARSRLRAVGIGTSAAGIGDENIDPKLAALIKATLQDATLEVTKAAAIIIRQGHDVRGLDRLVKISQRGQSLAANVAAVVPHQDKPPVLKTLVSLAKIEAQANAARMTAGPVATPAPCPTPTVTPAATPTESPTATPTDSPTATPDANATPTATPTTSPTVAPCTTPTPAPSATPGADENVTTTSEPTSTPAPTATPAADGGDANPQDNAQSSSDAGSPATMAGTSG